MKTLILMRHAKSDWSKPGQKDKERTLNNRGRVAAWRMGDWLREIETMPQVALVSSAQRTRETWDCMKITCDAVFEDALYLGEAEDYLKAVKTAPDCDCLLVLGHNPGMETAMGKMAGGQWISAPTAATGVYTLPIDHWRDAGFEGATLTAFETPKSLIQQSGSS